MSRGVATVLFVAITFGMPLHAAQSLGNAVDEPTLRHWLLFGDAALKTAVMAAFALFIFRRPESRKRSRDLIAWASCAGAIGAALFLQPPAGDVALGAVVAGELLVIAAVAFTFVSVLSLGTCFGVLPEVRGLVTRGPYRFVRHPVYLGEIAAFLGFVIASQHLVNILPLVLFAVSQAVRLRLEEEALLAEFPEEYGAYAARTPRFVPGRRRERRPVGRRGEVAVPAA